MRSRFVAGSLAFAAVLVLSASCKGTDPSNNRQHSPSGQVCHKNGAQTGYGGRIYVCKGVTKNHHGTWRLKSNAEKGAVFL